MLCKNKENNSMFQPVIIMQTWNASNAVHYPDTLTKTETSPSSARSVTLNSTGESSSQEASF